ncbi:MAG TPA: vWA domain-containing protein [Cyclobacteriaceae bacterium]|jgi:hypothetical protein|nr:vWA domain-containing protein [Cyclobacteriaceae bacterium]
MKNSSIIFLFVVLGCAGLPVDKEYNSFPETKDAIVVRQARYIDNNSTDVTFELDLYHLRGYDYGHIVSSSYFFNDYLDSTFFTFSANGQFKFVSAATAKANSTTPSSAVILVDESGSYDTLDQFNSRTQGIVKLCQDFITPSQYMLGGFSKNGNVNNQPADFIQSNLTPYSQDQMPLIFKLTGKIGGKSNLYDAVNGAIDKFSVLNSNKSIIVLARTNDEVSSSSLNAIIAKATANQIQVHVLFLGTPAVNNSLPKLAESTGGLYVSCPSIKELMCAFENLYSVLSGAANLWRFRVNFKPAGGVSSGQEFSVAIQVRDPLYKIDYNPIVAYVKVP